MNLSRTQKMRLGAAALILLAILATIFVALRCSINSSPFPPNELDAFYYVGSEPAKTVLAEYGAKPVSLDQLESIATGSSVIFDGQTADLDFSIIKNLVRDHTVYLINVESTLKIANEVFGSMSYEDFLGSDQGLKQLLKISMDPSGHPVLTVITYLDTAAAGYQDLVRALLTTPKP